MATTSDRGYGTAHQRVDCHRATGTGTASAPDRRRDRPTRRRTRLRYAGPDPPSAAGRRRGETGRRTRQGVIHGQDHDGAEHAERSPLSSEHGRPAPQDRAGAMSGPERPGDRGYDYRRTRLGMIRHGPPPEVAEANARAARIAPLGELDPSAIIAGWELLYRVGVTPGRSRWRLNTHATDRRHNAKAERRERRTAKAGRSGWKARAEGRRGIARGARDFRGGYRSRRGRWYPLPWAGVLAGSMVGDCPIRPVWPWDSPKVTLSHLEAEIAAKVMPVRPRRERWTPHTLTMHRDLALTIGSSRDDEPLDTLRAVFDEHRHRFGPTDWCVQMFDHGHDTRGDRDQGDDNVADVERRLAAGEHLGEHELEQVVGLPGPWGAQRHSPRGGHIYKRGPWPASRSRSQGGTSTGLGAPVVVVPVEGCDGPAFRAVHPFPRETPG
jgi:hypothetical protein